MIARIAVGSKTTVVVSSKWSSWSDVYHQCVRYLKSSKHGFLSLNLCGFNLELDAGSQ